MIPAELGRSSTVSCWLSEIEEDSSFSYVCTAQRRWDVSSLNSAQVVKVTTLRNTGVNTHLCWGTEYRRGGGQTSLYLLPWQVGNNWSLLLSILPKWSKWPLCAIWRGVHPDVCYVCDAWESKILFLRSGGKGGWSQAPGHVVDATFFLFMMWPKAWKRRVDLLDAYKVLVHKYGIDLFHLIMLKL